MAEKDKDILENIGEQEYKYGFTSDIETETIGKGLSEDVVRLISAKKGEPAWMTERRVAAYRHWLTMEPPTWAHLTIPEIDFQDIIYYAAPKQQKKLDSMDEVDPELKRTFDKLGIPLEEQMALAGVAVDAVMDSVSVKTTFKEVLAEKGIIFCSISEALRDFPDLVKKYLGSVVPYTDNFYAALNAAVFSDGSFCYIPKGVRCPMELSTYFRINAAGTGQFERTLIVADEGAYVSYLEGCTAPRRDENQLHAAVVEIIVEKDAEVKYSTVQNWYPGDKEGRGGIYNFVTKRGICRENARLSWTQVETGSAITWKYPSCILAGDNSVGEFYSVAMTNNFQQADTGTKMIHIGRNTRSRIVSKGISAGRSENSYRGLVRMAKGADNARNYSQCDSLLIGDKCGAHTFPVIDSRNRTAGNVRHDLEDFGRPALLLQPAGPFDRGRRGADRERLCPRGAGQTADGIRCRGAETAFDQPRRLGRITDVEDESAGAQRQSAAQRSGFADAGTYCRQSAGDVRRRAYFRARPDRKTLHGVYELPLETPLRAARRRCAPRRGGDPHGGCAGYRFALLLGQYERGLESAVRPVGPCDDGGDGERNAGGAAQGTAGRAGGDVQHDISIQRVVQPDPRGVPRPARDTPVERLPHRRHRGQKRLPQGRQADGQRD